MVSRDYAHVSIDEEIFLHGEMLYIMTLLGRRSLPNAVVFTVRFRKVGGRA